MKKKKSTFSQPSETNLDENLQSLHFYSLYKFITQLVLDCILNQLAFLYITNQNLITPMKVKLLYSKTNGSYTDIHYFIFLCFSFPKQQS